MNRREFLAACGALTVAAGLAPAPVMAWRSVDGAAARRVERTRLGMGTFVTITAVHASRQAAEEAAEAAFQEMRRLEAVLSRHDPDSALSALNAAGRLRGAPEPLVDVAGKALRLHRSTGGAFDPTVAPVVDLLRRHQNPGGELALSEAEIREAAALAGADKVRVRGRDIDFAARGVQLTLDGAAKGCIVDRMSRAMVRAGVENHLINAGGDIRASGRPAPGELWRAGLEDPVRGGISRTIALPAGGLASSGGYAAFYDRSREHHHIVRPVDGVSPRGTAAASVFAPTVGEADGLATAMMVLGLRRGAALAGSLPGRGACFTLPSGAVSAHGDFPA